MVYADNRFISNPGSPIHLLYSPVVNADGTISLVVSGKENTDDIIQTYAESCDIRLILSRASEGDFSGFSSRSGTFGDFTKVPKTFAEALQLQIDSNKLFESLPAEVREKFDYNANQFFASSGTSDWFDKLKDVIPSTMQNPSEVFDFSDKE